MKPTWPYDNQQALERFYGKLELGADGVPTPAWESRNLTLIVPPYPMWLAWDPTKPLLRIRCHRLVRDSLTRILATIKDRFPSVEARHAAGVDLFGGVYQFRRVSGAARLSCHAFACAIDLDPERNPRGQKPVIGKGLPLGAVDAFRDEGWVWGGDWVNKPDAMHFQATMPNE